MKMMSPSPELPIQITFRETCTFEFVVIVVIPKSTENISCFVDRNKVCYTDNVCRSEVDLMFRSIRQSALPQEIQPKIVQIKSHPDDGWNPSKLSLISTSLCDMEPISA